MQQVLAFETDLLEYEDIFDGSHVIEAKTAELAEAAWAELDEVLELGGAFEAIDELKRRLVRSQAERVRRIETGEQKVVGVNCFTETAPSPLLGDGVVEQHPQGRPGGRGRADRGRRRWRSARDAAAVGGPSTSCGGWPRTTVPREHHGGDDRPGPCRRDDGRVGRRVA